MHLLTEELSEIINSDKGEYNMLELEPIWKNQHVNNVALTNDKGKTIAMGQKSVPNLATLLRRY